MSHYQCLIVHFWLFQVEPTLSQLINIIKSPSINTPPANAAIAPTQARRRRPAGARPLRRLLPRPTQYNIIAPHPLVAGPGVLVASSGAPVAGPEPVAATHYNIIAPQPLVAGPGVLVAGSEAPVADPEPLAAAHSSNAGSGTLAAAVGAFAAAPRPLHQLLPRPLRCSNATSTPLHLASSHHTIEDK